jgi:histone acetyltransferase (RNA polymerase elongator complex component)
LYFFSNFLAEKFKFTKNEILDILCCIPEIARIEERNICQNIEIVRKYFSDDILKQYPLLITSAHNAEKVLFYLNLYLEMSREEFTELIKKFPILLTAEVGLYLI